MLMRSQSTSFPISSRTHASSNGFVYTPPSPISISVDKCTSRPGFGERFSYNRYTVNPYSTTYYAYNPNMSILEDSRSRNSLDNNFNIYLAKMAVRPRYGFNIEKNRLANLDKKEIDDTSSSSYQTRHFFKTNCASTPQTKYWMTSRYWESERQKARQKAHNWALHK